MTNETHIVFSCGHAKPEVSNERFSLLSKLIYDIKPDKVIDLGDGADMSSLNSYDTKKPEMIVSQNYEQDIESYNDSQERLRHEFTKAKKRKPEWVGFEGNHEQRIKTAISFDPRLHGIRYGISFSHLNTSKWFDQYHEYEHGAPAIKTICGIDYAHFVGAGNYGRAISGTHHAYGLIQKRYRSCTVGHSHKRSVHFKDETNAIGLVAGCFKGSPEGWAGQSNGEWWSGVVIKRNVSGDGMYEPQFVSLKTLEKEYG